MNNVDKCMRREDYVTITPNNTLDQQNDDQPIGNHMVKLVSIYYTLCTKQRRMSLVSLDEGKRNNIMQTLMYDIVEYSFILLSWTPPISIE